MKSIFVRTEKRKAHCVAVALAVTEEGETALHAIDRCAYCSSPTGFVVAVHLLSYLECGSEWHRPTDQLLPSRFTLPMRWCRNSGKKTTDTHLSDIYMDQRSITSISVRWMSSISAEKRPKPNLSPCDRRLCFPAESGTLPVLCANWLRQWEDATLRRPDT